MANKVTQIINCAGNEVPDHWEPIGVRYLTYTWADMDNQVILTFEFIFIGHLGLTRSYKQSVQSIH